MEQQELDREDMEDVVLDAYFLLERLLKREQPKQLHAEIQKLYARAGEFVGWNTLH